MLYSFVFSHTFVFVICILSSTVIQMSFHLTIPEQAQPYFDCAKKLSSNGTIKVLVKQFRCEFSVYIGIELYYSGALHPHVFEAGECGFYPTVMNRFA